MRAVGGNKSLVYKSLLLFVVVLVLQSITNIYASVILPVDLGLPSTEKVKCEVLFSESISSFGPISLDEKLQDRVSSLTSDNSFETIKSILEGVYFKDDLMMSPTHTFTATFRNILIPLITTKLFQHISSKLSYSRQVRRQDDPRIWDMLFLSENLDILYGLNLDKLKDKGPETQVTEVWNVIKKDIESKLKAGISPIIGSLIHSHILEELWQKTGYYAKQTYAQLVKKELIEQTKKLLITTLLEYKNRYQELSDFDIEANVNSAESTVYSALSLDVYPIVYEDHSSINDSTLRFSIPSSSISGKFESSISSFILYKNETSADSRPHFTLLHGAGTISSNSVSYVKLMPRLTSSFFVSSSAADLPGSMGKIGILPPDIKNPYEISSYLDKWLDIEATNHLGPLVVYGRSLGSTFAFNNALIHAINNRTPIADMYVLTSFSNPTTIEEQWDIVSELAKIDPSVQLVEGMREYLIDYTNDLMSILNNLKETDPSILETVGENMLFIQGEADSDGGEDPVGGLLSFTKEYIPTASVYVIPDPLKNHPEIASKLGADKREASHFLLNNRDNEDQAVAKRLGIDPKFLPRYFDQSVEVMALTHLWLDFIIDMSFSTPQSKREKLAKQRHLYTSSDSKFAYFKKFIFDLNHKKKSKLNLDISKIVLDTEPGSDSIEQRLKRLILFVHQEYLKKCEYNKTSPEIDILKILSQSDLN